MKKIKHTRKIVDKDGCTTSEDKELEIHITRGWKAGTRVTFPGDGDVSHGVASELVVIIEEAQHPLFTRDGNNLLYKVCTHFHRRIV